MEAKQDKKGKKVSVKLNLPEGLHRKIKAYSALKGQSIPEMVESIISEWIDKTDIKDLL